MEAREKLSVRHDHDPDGRGCRQIRVVVRERDMVSEL